MQKLLIVDDEKQIQAAVQRYLKQNGFATMVAEEGSQALLIARDSRPDLVLADAKLPGMDGHALCRVLKTQPDTSAIPVILMSGFLVQEKDILSGLEGGADDYVLKPFSLPLLLAKIRVVLRRYEASSRVSGQLRRKGLELDPGGRTVRANGKTVALTRKEFDLLATLMDKAGRVLSVPYLLETVWGYDPADYNDPGTVEVHVSHLRKKLGPKLGSLLVNVVGHGYKFEV